MCLLLLLFYGVLWLIVVDHLGKQELTGRVFYGTPILRREEKQGKGAENGSSHGNAHKSQLTAHSSQLVLCYSKQASKTA